MILLNAFSKEKAFDSVVSLIFFQGRNTVFSKVLTEKKYGRKINKFDTAVKKSRMYDFTGLSD